MTSPPPWILERNLILQAGAGTGKTRSLVTVALHLLCGATARRQPVPASRLVALTFTEKAGAEMRSRLLQRVTRLSEGTPLGEDSPELAASLDWLGLATPTQEMWRRIRRDLPLAFIGTFHSFCAGQLRRLARAARIDASFDLMDEDAAAEVFNECATDLVLERLAREDRGVRALVDEYDLSTDRGGGVIDLVRMVLQRISEEGRSPESLDDGRFSDESARAGLDAAIAVLRDSVEGLMKLEARHRAKLTLHIGAYRTLVAQLTLANWAESVDRLRVIRKGFRKPPNESGAPVVDVDEAVDALQAAGIGLQTAPLGRDFVALATDVAERYSVAKRERHALDFSDLQRVLRDLLRNNAEARRIVKSRFDALLVDEVQDTSRIQLDIVSMLAESRAAEADLSSAATVPEAIRFEPGLLCIVGDRKQSIYDFRGADAAVFQRAEALLLDPVRSERPASVEYLQSSRRSRPALVDLANALFSRVMAAASEPFQVAFMPGDHLVPVLTEPPSGPLAEIMESVGDDADQQRTDEARRIAARIDQLVHGEASTRPLVRRLPPHDSEWRPVEGRDIAILFRRMSFLDSYRNALAARGITHVVVGGSGFYSTREVLDAWALLRAIDDPADPVASAAVLRSPWCTLRDDTITRLALSEGGARFEGVSLLRLLGSRAPLDDADEEARLQTLLRFVAPMRREMDRLGAAATLELALRELDYFAVASALPEADSIAANVEKLLRLLRKFESRTPTARGVVRMLTERIREPPREQEAASAEEDDPRCVRLMTIHQAKGLEFPVVFLADTGAAESLDATLVEYDRDLGMGLCVRGLRSEPIAGPRIEEIRTRLRARADAESMRLLYVAVTRARDYLVVSGAPRKNSWFELIANLGDEHVRRVVVDPASPRLGGAAPTRAQATIAVARPERVPVDRILTTVERLSDFGECAERYRLRHEVGVVEPRPSVGDDAPGDLDPDSLEAIEHALLKAADCEPLDDEGIDGLLWAQGANPERAQLRKVRDAVRTFLAGPVAAALHAVPDTQRFEALPFHVAVNLGEGRRLDLKGRIDLLTLTADGARVLNYASSDTDPAKALFRLQCYALVVRQLIGASLLPTDVGVVPLGTPEKAVTWSRLYWKDLGRHTAEIQRLGSALVEALATNRWERQRPARCEDLRCGFRPRCYG